MTRHTREHRAPRTQDRRLVLHRTHPAADQAVPADAPAITHPEATRDHRGAA
ncbi:hypothetical protein [Streptomyces sp. NRRL F-2664]|uniref:hypothetical protein n=1 Tax=Streptomyces sp. NRRL F-2664 TaxID=1463842 RepID=UPI00131A60E2|nr:hypothetical protein [Streptomyces sp. NRRL F-2664]